MALDIDQLPDEVLTFLTEYHLATLTTQRADGTPHVVPAGFSYQPDARVARVITSAGSQKRSTCSASSATAERGEAVAQPTSRFQGRSASQRCAAGCGSIGVSSADGSSFGSRNVWHPGHQ